MVKFNDLLASAKQEVDELAKRETSLQRTIKSLEGRETFLTTDIKKLEARREAVLLAIDIQIKKNTAVQQEADKRLVATRAETTQLTAEHETLKSTYQTEISELQATVDGLNTDVSDRRNELAELLKAKTDWQDELAVLKADILAAREEIKSFDEKINQARTAADEQIADFDASVKLAESQLKTIQSQTSDATEELKAINEKIEIANVTLADTTKQHNDFIEYEKRARKALKDAEESLLRKEEQLDVQIVTSRRRRILDNVE